MHRANCRASLATATSFVVIGLCFAPATAGAQLGGFIKRAIGEKVAEKAAEKIGEKVQDPRADSSAPAGRASRMKGAGAPMASIQLTADTLEHALRGLDALARAFARRDSMQRVADGVGRRLSELSSTNGELGQTYREKSSVINSCRRDAFRAIANKRGEDLQRRMAADPAAQRKFAEIHMNYSKAATEAIQRGDSATLQKLQLDYYRALLGPGFNSRQDTVSVQHQCGAELVKPPALALEDSLRRESQRLTEGRRELEISARTDAIAQSGLPADRFDAARERIEMWYRGKKAGLASFPPVEEQALEAQRPRIERIMLALGVQR